MASETAEISVLKRKVGGGAPVTPVTATRALRQSFARAAEDVAQLALTVLSINEEIAPLEEHLASIDNDWLMIVLQNADGPVGMAAVDIEFLSALIESQTLGLLSPNPATPRAATATDAALVAPLFDQFMMDLTDSAAGTPLAGWTDGYTAAERYLSTRAAGLELAEADYRKVLFSLDPGVEERTGKAIILLPVDRNKPQVVADPSTMNAAQWADTLEESVMGTSAELHAVLHRMRLPLSMIEAWEVGSEVVLFGVTVSSVQVEGVGEREIGAARLGQINGMRAIRLEREIPPLMEQLPELGAASAPSNLANAAEMPPLEMGIGLDIEAMPDPIEHALADEEENALEDAPNEVAESAA